MHTTNNTSHPLRTIVLTILITLIVAVVVGYVFGVVRFSHSKKTTGQKSSTENNMSMSAQSNTAKPGQRKILYWRAPMNPKEIYNHPGKSAMGMDLVPVYEDAVSGGATITIDPVIQQDMGVRMAKVTEGPLTYTIRTYGHITPDPDNTSPLTVKQKKLLARVIAYYQHTLEESTRGLDYLKNKRGISRNQSLKDFGAGYVNGTLLTILPDDKEVMAD